MKMNLELADRIRQLPPYPFAAIDKKKAELQKQGKDLIDLGIGDPDLPTPPHIVAALQAAAAEPGTHRYPSYDGLLSLRQAGADYYRSRFGVTGLDPEREVVVLIGSKEGIGHFPVAFVNPGDVVLVPDPGYPVYATWTRFCGGEVHYLPLRRESGFLPDLSSIPESVLRRARMLWINYPNNPTAAMAPSEFYKGAVDFAHRHGILIASDMCYSEIYFGDTAPGSFLSIDGAKECGIEFYSLSKPYNMTGWRVAFAVGNQHLVQGLLKVKTHVDSGTFEAVQRAAIAALTGPQEGVHGMRALYRERRDVLVSGLRQAGYDVLNPEATFYALVACPRGLSSADFAVRLLEAGVVGTPASAFGPSGEGYVRLALCTGVDRIREAVRRLQEARI